MDTSNLKRYAPKARREFLRAVTDRAIKFGITKDKTEPMTEQGDVVIIGDKAYPKSVGDMRKKLIGRIKESNFEQVMEEAAYTWFNRLIAIRYMELHGYLDHGYRVLSHPDGRDLPEIVDHAETLDLPGLKTDKVIELKLDGTKEAGLYRMLLVAQCNALNRSMPFMFDYIEGDIELLLPDNLLHSDSIVRQLVKEVPEQDWTEIECIGWLYQFYISEKKDEVFAALKKGKKISPANIPAATQLFTPHWIVRYLVENSLGRLWMLNHPDSRLIEQMDYYIRPEEPETDFLRVSSPEELKICDPACGSGHMLTYAFDLLYAIYEEQGYQANEIPQLILTNNLYGIEIDKRAGALAAFALTMKAREKYRRFLSVSKAVQPNICVLENIKIEAEELSAYLGKVGQDLLSGGLRGVVNQWEEADNFGSLIRPMVTDVNEVLRLLHEHQMDEDLFLAGVHKKVLGALRYANYLRPKYHVIVANPPYMGTKGMNDDMKQFAKSNYPDAKMDAMTCFMERASELVNGNGFWGMINLPSWMFLGSFENLRSKLVSTNRFCTLLHLGRGVFGSDFGTVAFTCFKPKKELTQLTGIYRRLFREHVEVRSVEDIETLFLDPDEGRFVADQSTFQDLPGTPIAYWVSEQVRHIFRTSKRLTELADACQGMATTNNGLFLRGWWEVSIKKCGLNLISEDAALNSGHKWFPYNKGGEFRKWYGNKEYVVNYEKKGQTICDYIDNTPGVKVKSNGRVINRDKYFRECISWSKVSAGSLAMRYFPAGFIFDVAGCSIFTESHVDLMFLLAYSNSNMVRNFLASISPTVNYEVGQMATLPIVEFDVSRVVKNTEEIIAKTKIDWDSGEESWDFPGHSLLNYATKETRLSDSYTKFNDNRVETIAELRQCEEENNQLLLQAYGLQEEMPFSVELDEITLRGNPSFRYGEGRSAENLESLLLADTMREFISYAVGCMLGRYSLDKPGLILANQGETIDDYRQQIPKPTFAPDEDNVIPILDSDWFSDDVANRFIDFLQITFGKERFTENLAFLESAIGKPVRNYFLTECYKHHLKLYKNRPIYWLFSSGKQKAFQALIYLHRYNPGTLSRMRTSYVVPLQGKFNGRLEQIESEIGSISNASRKKALEKERAKLTKQREELITFDEKLRHYADQKIEIDLDDGVKVNYAKFGDLLAEVKAVTGAKAE